MDLVEQVLRYDFAKSPIVVSDCLIEPFERFVGLAAEGVDVGDVVRQSFSYLAISTSRAASASAARPSAR